MLNIIERLYQRYRKLGEHIGAETTIVLGLKRE
jgi:hypothetical protein